VFSYFLLPTLFWSFQSNLSWPNDLFCRIVPLIFLFQKPPFLFKVEPMQTTDRDPGQEKGESGGDVGHHVLVWIRACQFHNELSLRGYTARVAYNVHVISHNILLQIRFYSSIHCTEKRCCIFISKGDSLENCLIFYVFNGRVSRHLFLLVTNHASSLLYPQCILKYVVKNEEKLWSRPFRVMRSFKLSPGHYSSGTRH
jgi:hypothetical protein